MKGRAVAFTSLFLLPALLRATQDVRPSPVAVEEPRLRIGLLVDVTKATVGGTRGIRILDPEEGLLTAITDSIVMSVSVGRGTVTLKHEAFPDIQRRSLVIEPFDSTGFVTLGGKSYRGTLELRAGDGGLTVVNRIAVEQYLVGVVSGEMGARPADEVAALRAQAVASRTYALRHRGRRAERGFDLIAGVSDQVYVGIAAENESAAAAVLATRGEVLMYEGALIEAFYFSTCSGRTEDGHVAFEGGRQPYLKSIVDEDSTGRAWCASSPRYQWTENWTATQLANTLRRTLPANSLSSDRATDLTDLRTVDRSATHRVTLLEMVGKKGRTTVTGQDIRYVLESTAGGILRSNDFTIKVTRQGSKLVRVQISGRGNGHGVGMCQWGAIGRARAGQDYSEILISYFPGTQITRMYQ